MAFFRKSTVKTIVVIIGTIFAFNTLPKFPYLATYLEQYYYIVFIIAVILIAYSGKIAERLGGE